MFKKTHLHFIGIGGIGMSGIAEVLLNLGHTVTGSDLKKTELSLRLEERGAKIFYEHQADNISGAEVIVTSSAVHLENPEWIAAREQGIPVIRRAEMLAELMRMKYGIAIAGSHGKTTTTSLIATILDQANLDPTLVIGGRVKTFGSNAKLGKGEFLVAEADESDGTFNHLSPTVAVITNIDPEHLDHYGSFESLCAAFVEFGNKIPFYGAVVACQDHPTVKKILPQIKKRVLTYGLEETADFYARNIHQEGLKLSFDVYKKLEKLGEIQLSLGGLHNVYNTLAAIAVSHELQIPFEKIQTGLAHFKGIERRMEPLYQGEIMVVDDYGHHPEEIKATLSAIKIAFPKKRIITLFQPHRYSRTRDLINEFEAAFGNADLLFVTEIYAAGEAPIEGISGKIFAEKILLQKKNGVYFHQDKESLFEETCRILQPNDLVITLGAGDIVQVGRKIALKLQTEDSKK